MLAIVVDTERGERCVRPSAEELAGLVRRIGADGDRYVVVGRIPEVPEVYAQVWHDGVEYVLEHREGSADSHFTTTLDSPEPVADALVGWARGAAGWDDGLEWAPLDFGLDLDEEDRGLLEERVREALRGGYLGRAELVEVAEEYLVTDDSRPVSPEQAGALVDRLWREQLDEQNTWEGETDPERLTRAFTTLETAGITARENFTCCRTCGNAEIAGERAPGSHGFVYFHSQGTDCAAAGGGLMLYYGAFDDSEQTTAAVGHQVVAALDTAGLTAVWDGDPGSAIHLTPLDWRRRLTATV